MGGRAGFESSWRFDWVGGLVASPAGGVDTVNLHCPTQLHEKFCVSCGSTVHLQSREPKEYVHQVVAAQVVFKANVERFIIL